MTFVSDDRNAGADEDLMATLTEWMRICVDADTLYEALPPETRRSIITGSRTVETLARDLATLPPSERCRIESALLQLAHLVGLRPVSRGCERSARGAVRRFPPG